ncbi:MAG TPA: sigma-70 family RNA polymerase sigma factor [Solirubrobacteraceae bacterium]|nr:sigma-70 family RNA polymerase sigma factor [Solirubrobacteraceae bacterium]
MYSGAGAPAQGDQTLSPDIDLADIYDENVWRVFGFFAYRLERRADAEDLTQLTFERAVRAWGRYDPAKGSVATWLLAIAQNLLIDHLRRRPPGPTVAIAGDGFDEGVLPSTPGPEAAAGLDPRVSAALATLGERERLVIALRFGGDLAGPDIARLLDLSLANVQQILSRSLRKLRRELDGYVP